MASPILVTGASGHLGSHLVAALLRDRRSVLALSRHPAISNLPTAEIDERLQLVQCDLSEPSDVERNSDAIAAASVVVHLAGHVPRSGVIDIPACVAGNTVATANLCAAVRPDARVVVASTTETYGVPTDVPIPESHPQRPTSAYGASKVAAERIASAFGHGRGKGIAVLRFASIYGPGETISRAIPNFIRRVMDGKRPEIHGDGGELRSYIYIDDAVRSLQAAIDSRACGIYNIASEEAVSVYGLAEAVIGAVGADLEPLCVERTGGEPVDYVYSVEAAARELGFSAEVGLSEGLDQEIIWYGRQRHAR